MGRGSGETETFTRRDSVGDEKFYLELARRYRQLLTGEEASALASYSRTVHELVNRTLRGRGSRSDVYFATPWITTLTAALAKAVPVEAPLMLHRGFSDKDFYRQRLKPGQVISDPGFCSTSIHSRSIERFANEYYASKDRKPEPYRVYWTVRVPVGGRIAPLGNLADNPFECECVLPAGSRFKVLDVNKSRRNGGELRLTLELLV